MYFLKKYRGSHCKFYHVQVSIVNHTLSLASNVSDPPLPFFSKDAIEYAVQTVVDGFLDRYSTPFCFLKLFSSSAQTLHF